MKLNKLLAIFLSALIFLSCFAFPSFAEGGPFITVTPTATAVPGDTVAVSIDIADNPGIMAMTFAVSYDKDAFTYDKYTLGKWNDYTIVAHQDKGYVSFVNCEVKNRKFTGTIFTLYFTVTDTAAPGEHHFKIANIDPMKYGEDLKGCFATKEHTPITATVTNGTTKIGKTCSNSGHTFSEFKTTLAPTCIATGLRERSCSVCGHTETKELEKSGHSFQKDWTVDTVATAEQTGIMSRHCENCSEVTDKVYFSLEETEENELKNEEEAVIPPTDWEKLEEIEKENELKEKEEQLQKDKNTDKDMPSTQASKGNSSFFGAIGNFFARIFKAIGNFFKNLFS